MVGNYFLVNSKPFFVEHRVSVYCSEKEQYYTLGPHYIQFRITDKALWKELKETQSLYCYTGYSIRTIIQPTVVRKGRYVRIYCKDMLCNKFKGNHFDPPIEVVRKLKILALKHELDDG